jgi:hypothetical protein
LDTSTGIEQGDCHNGFYKGVADQLSRYARGWVKYETENLKYEFRKGSGEYMTLRQMLEKTKRGHLVDEYEPDPQFMYLVDLFWRVRQFCGQDDPVSPHVLRAIIYQMDAEFRGALSKQRRDNDRYAMQRAQSK